MRILEDQSAPDFCGQTSRWLGLLFLRPRGFQKKPSVAAGRSLMFGIMRIINIAHGDFIILAAYFAIVVTETLGVDPLVALVFVAPLMLAWVTLCSAGC